VTLEGEAMPVEDSVDNENICKNYCGSCPSYPKSGEWFFCARKKSAKSAEREGCLCPGCDVYEKYNLSSMYYCDTGAAE
jgi:hypothetical protein